VTRTNHAPHLAPLIPFSPECSLENYSFISIPVIFSLSLSLSPLFAEISSFSARISEKSITAHRSTSIHVDSRPSLIYSFIYVPFVSQGNRIGRRDKYQASPLHFHTKEDADSLSMNNPRESADSAHPSARVEAMTIKCCSRHDGAH